MPHAVWIGLLMYFALIVGYYLLAARLAYRGPRGLEERSGTIVFIGRSGSEDPAMPTSWRTQVLHGALLFIGATTVLGVAVLLGGYGLRFLVSGTHALLASEILAVTTLLREASPRWRWVARTLVACLFLAAVLTRHWVLNNLLGLAGGLGLLLLVRRTPRKIAQFASIVLIAYDAIHVFWSGLMIRAATDAEGTSAVLQIPAANASLTPLMFLGMGDVLVPGVVVLIGMRLAILNGRPRLAIGALVGNVIGHAISTFALVLSDHGQPALIYLLPCTWLGIWIASRGIGPLTDIRLDPAIEPEKEASPIRPRLGPARRQRRPRRQRKRWR